MIVERSMVGGTSRSRISAAVFLSSVLVLTSVAMAIQPTPPGPARETTPSLSGRNGAGYDAWLRYDPVDERTVGALYNALPAVIVTPDDSALVTAARDELVKGVRGMLGRTLRVVTRLTDENAIILGKLESIKSAIPASVGPAGLKEDGYLLKSLRFDGKSYLIITGPNDRGVLYGAFALLRKIGLCEPIDDVNDPQQPYAPVRMLDQWDNLDSTIERGYAGPSIFFETGDVVSDLTRV